MINKSIHTSLTRHHQTYLALDFETTGLSHTKDEPIQIGIVQFDQTGRVLETYSSYLQPQGEVTPFIQRLTGITPHDVADAPRPDEIVDQIAHFFTPETIIVGHNIMFDIRFLRQFLPISSSIQSIDTYQFARMVYQFMPSYALEVLSTKLGIHTDESHHDALADCHLSAKLYIAMLDRIEAIAAQTPSLITALTKSRETSIFHRIYDLDLYDTQTPPLTIPARPSSSSYHTTAKPANPLTLDLHPQHKHYTNHTTFGTLLGSIASRSGTIICSFSAYHKLSIAKSVLKRKGISVQWGLDEATTFDTAKRSTILAQPSLYDAEVETYLAYCAHIHDSARSYQRRGGREDPILSYITADTARQTASSSHRLIVCTHDQLMSAISDTDPLLDDVDEIFFFDRDWRYPSYARHVTRSLSRSYLLGPLERLLYRLRLEQHASYSILAQLYGRLVVIIAQIHRLIDTISLTARQHKKQTKGATATFDITGAILDHATAYRPATLWQRRYDEMQSHKTLLGDLIVQRLAQFDTFLHSDVRIDRHNDHEGYERYTFRALDTLIDYQGFAELMRRPTGTAYFLTNTDTTATIISSAERAYDADYPTDMIISTQSPATIIGLLPEAETKAEPKSIDTTSQIIYIMCNKKRTGENVIEQLHKQLSHSTNTTSASLPMIHGENITGGHGKIRYLVQHHRDRSHLIVGGLGLLLQLYAHEIGPERIVIHTLDGNLVPVILRDILSYHPHLYGSSHRRSGGDSTRSTDPASSPKA